MNTDRLAAISRAVDAAIRWNSTPKWCRRGLVSSMRRAYRRPGESRASRDAKL